MTFDVIQGQREGNGSVIISFDPDDQLRAFRAWAFGVKPELVSCHVEMERKGRQNVVRLVAKKK